MNTTASLSEQVAALAEKVQSKQQHAMINELKKNGLLNPPTFNLAYGPVSFNPRHAKQ